MALPSKVIVVGAAWYGDWARLFTKALQRLGANAEIVYNNSMPAPLGGNAHAVTSLFEKAKRKLKKISPRLFGVLKAWRRRLAEREILIRLRGLKAGERALIVFTWTPGSDWILQKLKKRPGITLVLWLGEPTARDASWEPKFDYFDHLFIVDDGAWVDILQEKNKKRMNLLPLAADETIFYPLAKVDAKYAADIVFIGQYYFYKAQSLEVLKDYNFRIYGYGWEKGFEQLPWLKEKYGGPLPTEELNLVYNGAKLAIGTIGTPKDKFTTATMRTFDIALTGVFQIGEESYLGKKLFGDTLGFFREEKELKGLIDYYLSHEQERKEKAARSRAIALNYTYTAAAKNILALVEE